MTCHMINESTYERNSYILGCRRMKGSHNYINIAEMMTDITETYKLDHSKITHTVTDNAIVILVNHLRHFLNLYLMYIREILILLAISMKIVILVAVVLIQLTMKIQT